MIGEGGFAAGHGGGRPPGRAASRLPRRPAHAKLGAASLSPGETSFPVPSATLRLLAGRSSELAGRSPSNRREKAVLPLSAFSAVPRGGGRARLAAVARQCRGVGGGARPLAAAAALS